MTLVEVVMTLLLVYRNLIPAALFYKGVVLYHSFYLDD